ncbi:MAG TPA: hypothetical protein VFU15_05385 [Bacteroidia bacterium]|nr:hypothetical protein [Bacteroidia bacterium]
MNLETPEPSVAVNLPAQTISTLKKLDRKRTFSEKRFSLWFLAPFLAGIPLVLAFVTDYSWLLVFSIIWIFVVIFGLGAFIHVILPEPTELSRVFKKSILPGLLNENGLTAKYYSSHGLKPDSFMKAGLFRENYSHFERLDCISGKYRNIPFWLYELKVQTSDTMGRGLVFTPRTRVVTTVFYGWVLHVPVRTLHGKVFIIPRREKKNDESDDWVKTTREYFGDRSDYSPLLFDNPEFNARYIVFSDRADRNSAFTAPVLAFFSRLYDISPNAPAFSFCEDLASMHVGISDDGFDLDPGRPSYPDGTDKASGKLRFFSAVVSGLYSVAGEMN